MDTSRCVILCNIPSLRFLLLSVLFLDFTVAPLDLGRGDPPSSEQSESESKAIWILSSTCTCTCSVIKCMQC